MITVSFFVTYYYMIKNRKNKYFYQNFLKSFTVLLLQNPLLYIIIEKYLQRRDEGSDPVRLEKWVESVLRRFHRHGFEAYAVGGCVRDALLGRTPHDYDITTSALPREIRALFEETVDIGGFGTVCVILPQGRVEVTTFRADGSYEDHRHPDKVRFGVSLAEDVRRRDFTVNALCWDGDRVIDLVDGQKDLRDSVMRTVGDPRQRFAEDPLRILRLYRFAAQLDFTVDPETESAARRAAPLLAGIGAPRIGDELDKLLLTPRPESGRAVFPLLPGGFAAKGTLSDLPPDLICRWAGLFFRAGKDEAPAVSFLRGLHRSNRIVYGTRDVLRGLAREDDIGHLLWKYGRETTERILHIKDPARLDELRAFLSSGRCWRPEDLALNGFDLLSAGVPPKQIGETLSRLTEHVLSHPEDNTPERLRQLIKERQNEKDQ